MSDKEFGEWHQLERKRVYDNPWIEVYHDEVLNPNGGQGIYGVVHFMNLAIGIVPVDENGWTWLVGQKRYPIDRYTWEIPEGGGPIGIDPLVSAKRELLEEVGLTADLWKLVQQSELSNSVTDERAIIYLATGLSSGEAQPEETERLEIKHLPLQEAIEMVDKGEITDSLSVMGLLRVDREYRKGRITWKN